MPHDPESELWERICESVSAAAGSRAAVAFSGGVDSSLVALACKRLGLDPVLLTIGFEGSRDVRFASHIAGLMDIEHHARIIDASDVKRASRHVDAVVGTCSMSWKENCIALYHVTELCSSIGVRSVITANGIDELFCGYDAYRKVAGDVASATLMMREKLRNERLMMRAVGDVTAAHGVRIVQPLLLPGFAEYAMRIPLDLKITGPGDLLRKHVVRRLAERVGVPPKSAYSRKKALQYGSGIHRSLVRLSALRTGELSDRRNRSL